MALDRLRITLSTHELKRHPQLQRVKAARTHLTIAKEVKLDIGAATVFAQILRRDVERVAQYAAAIAHQCSAARKRNEQPFVRIKGYRISLFDTVQLRFVLFRKR